jgi:hypothetical protein
MNRRFSRDESPAVFADRLDQHTEGAQHRAVVTRRRSVGSVSGMTRGLRLLLFVCGAFYFQYLVCVCFLFFVCVCLYVC